MKKIALGILSVFMLFGGVLLSACTRENPSLSISTNYIEIYTNDADRDNYQQGVVEVTLDGSNDGIGVQVESGSDVVTYSTSRLSSSSFAVTLSAIKSGNAKVKIYAMSNQNIYEYVDVGVLTIPKSTSIVDQNDSEGRTGMFVVKGGEGTLLDVEKYIAFAPADANVRDVVWSFKEAGQEVSTVLTQSDGTNVATTAEIRDNRLYVYDSYSRPLISVYAIVVGNSSLSQRLDFQVIEDSSIEDFFINNSPLTSSDGNVEVDLIRNNSSVADEFPSQVTGQIVINTFDANMGISPKAYLVDSGREVTTEEYFKFSVDSRNYDTNESQLTINFTIDALYDDFTMEKRFGNLYFELELSYSEFIYSINTRDVSNINEAILKLSFVPESVVVRDSNGNDVGGQVIDLYSQYYNSQGYILSCNVYPDDIPLSNSNYQIVIDIGGRNVDSADDVLRVYNRNTGVQIPFVLMEGSDSVTTYITETEIANGTPLYFRSGDLNGRNSINGFEISFIASGNSAIATETITANLYHISMGSTMEIEEVDDEGNTITTNYSSTKYISSARNSLGVADTKEYYFKISGISSIEGLSLSSMTNRNFNISMEEYARSGQNDDEQFVIIKVTVSLNGVEFRDYTTFSFNHKSGLSSQAISLEAFNPLTSVSIYNNSRGANNIYDEGSEKQDYIISGGEIIKSGNGDMSLSTILVSAGSNVSLLLDYQNATLNTANITSGYQFLYLNSENAQMKDEDFAKLVIEDLDRLYEGFRVEENTYFTFTNGELRVSNSQFVIFVMVRFYGYDDAHEEVTFVRFFRLESFYPVTSLRSDIADTTLLSKESLSVNDEALSQVDVSLSLRNDDNPATYSSLAYFKVTLGTETSYLTNSDEEVNYTLSGQENNFENMLSLDQITYIYNDYLLLTNFRIVNNELRFNISAESTKFQNVVNEVVRIQYAFKNSIYPEIINVNIMQVDRVEEVNWLNGGADSSIYLNVASDDYNEKSFTINTSVGPSEAYNKELSYYYQPMDNRQNILDITPSSLGQSFTLSIGDASEGGWGYLYLLPADMIKFESGVRSALIYQLVDGEYEAYYRPLDEIHNWYSEVINGEKGSLNYFLNNDNERVYYRDIIIQIRVTIADGQSEETAIRIYSEEDFLNIKNNPNLYYRLMNDIELSDWESFEFSGMLFGDSEDVMITLNGDSLISTLSGVVKDLNIQGTSNGGAFVAKHINGENINISSYTRPTVENVNVDVVYNGTNYTPSVLSGSYNYGVRSYAGAIAGVNAGNIIDCMVYGVTMDTAGVDYVGGVAGYSYGLVSGSGVEFYNFAGDEPNKFLGGTVGGLVGYFGADGKNSTIRDSYVYAFNLNSGIGSSAIDSYTKNISATKSFYPLAGVIDAKGSIDATGSNVIETSFAFMGNHNYLVPQNSKVTIRNSYITYYYAQEDGLYYPAFSYYDDEGSNLPAYHYNDLENAVWSLDSSVWEIENISSEINFGFPYLKNVTQTPSVSVDQMIHTVAGKSLAVNDGADGILYNYSVRELILSDNASWELNSHNTISISELFGVTEREAESLLVSVNNQEYASFSNSNIVTKKTTDGLAGRILVLTLVSRTDFSKTKTYNIMILDAIPTFTTAINGAEIRDNQIVNVQTGIDNAQSINILMDDSIYLYGERYTLVLDDYEYYNEFDATNEFIDESETLNYFSAQVIGNNVIYEAENASDNSYVTATISLGVKNLGDGYEAYRQAIKNNNLRTISLSSYDGANSLIVDAMNLSLKPLETQSFSAVLTSDNINDKLDIQFGYEDEVFDVVYTNENNGTVTINDNLKLDIYITKEVNSLNYNVLLSVNRDYRHKVDKDYNLTIYVRPESQKNSDRLLNTISLLVQKQTIEDINVVNYMVGGKQLRNSTWYYSRTDQITSTITPGTETILSLEVNPNFAHISNFKVTYTLSNSSAGTVNLSRLLYNYNYGYYIDTSTTQALNSINSTERGLMVTPTENDLRNGIYYFRLYVSSSFTANSVINITFTFYDGDEVLATSTNSYSIDYISEAVVLVNGETSVILAKSMSATVTVEVDNDQTLDRIYLSGHGNYITMTDVVAVDNGTSTTYTAQIYTSVLSKLADGASTGSFNVEASVVGYVNGRATYKYSYATIYLVDFTVNAENVSIGTSASTAIYGGQEYDSFNSYINASSTLNFNYQINPANYSYNTANNDEVIAVDELIGKQNEFRNNGYYADVANSYYINYTFNSTSGEYEALSLRDRLYYVNSDGSATAIYNRNQGSFLENSTFSFSGGDNGNRITITGKQAGNVLLRLKTYVVIGNSTFEYDYDFVVAVRIWTDEEVPIPIYTTEEFLRYLQGNVDSEGNTDTGDYILMNDIVLTNYTPLSTQYFNSLDGNGYTIFLNSFNFSTTSTQLNLALFSEVTENSTIRNVRVNLYNGGQLTVNINTYTTVNVAGFALVNNGIIYNCDVVSFYDVNNSSSRVSGSAGLVVNFVKGNGGQATDLTTGDVAPENINIAGFVLNNNNIVTNSRVGGDTYKYIREEFDESFYDEMSLSLFTIQGQGYVSGFVGENSGTISASFASNVQINNGMRTTLSETAGFVRDNNGQINTSYVKGQYNPDNSDDYYYDGSTISATGKVGGFSYHNNGTIKNCYVNFAIEIEETRSYLSAGFVYENDAEGIVSLCFAQVKMAEEDTSYINNMSFSGVDEKGNSLNVNEDGISYCYYYSDERNIDIQANYDDVGAYAISRVNDESIYYRFSFSSEENALDGIWTMHTGDIGISLVSADHIAFSNRYIVYDEDDEEQYSLFYSTLRDYTTRTMVDLSYGSLNNPIIIRDAEDFAKATGKATDVEISSYSQYYNDYEVFGHYRFVSDIDFSTIDQNLADDNDIRLTTTTKDFSGILDGNGFTIHNMVLEGLNVVENYGLFARIVDGSIMNLGLEVASVHNGNASIVGTLAGTVIDSHLVGLTLNPVDTRDEEDTLVAISIHGNNIVGGVVGAVFGNSKLSDITIEDIDVAANYYDETKEIGYGDELTLPNANIVGDSLRGIIEAGGSLANNIRNLSYAGGLAGYVDIYEYEDEEAVTYDGSANYSTYDILTVRIYNSINIYGEVAGGFIGYLSATTIGYDMGLELDADMSLGTPSYITAKNLYAGGIVGESYGGLFACYAEYSRELQDMIEENMYSYYNGGSTVERGQMSIFSYTTEENDSTVNRHNNPYFVGGLVGYAGSGYISTSYNRLNVVSNVSNHGQYEAYYGGIVGVVDTDYYYSSEVMLSRSQVSYFMNETYFSGVLNSVTNVNEGGAIGLITQKSIVGLKNVNTMPYYENDSANMNKLFGLIGGFETEVFDSGNIEISFPTHIYILDNLNGHYDVVTGSSLAGGDSPTTSVAVSALYLAQNDITVNLATRYNYIFGYTDSLITVNNTNLGETVTSEITSDRIMQVEWIRDLSTMELAYTKMNQYFLRNDWDPNYWEHEVNTLYPRIVLTPRTNVIYLDAYEESIESVLDAIRNNSSLTVVVRGMIERDNPSGGYTDVDLRNYIDPTDRARNFSGTFVSYEEYMKTRNEGVITSQSDVVRDDGDGYIIGGTVGENVGLILDQPIFESVDYGFEMDSLNIYYTNERLEGTATGYTSLLVSRVSTNATFSNLDIHLNSSLSLEADANGMAGLLTAESVSSDFLNINIIFRRGNGTSSSAINFVDSNSAQQLSGGSQYFGILAGRMVQNSIYKGMTISNINFAIEAKTTGNATATVTDETIKFNFTQRANFDYTLYFGLLAGESAIESENTSTFRMTSLNRYLEDVYNIVITLSRGNSAVTLSEAYIGSYFGNANFTMIEGVLSDDDYPLNNITINQGLNVGREYLGLGFGRVVGSGTMTVSTNVERAVQFTVAGTINQTGTVAEAYIGGLIGQADMGLISIDNTVDTSVAISVGTNITTTARVGSIIGNLSGSFTAESFNTANGFSIGNDRTISDFNIYYGLIGSISASASVTLGTNINEEEYGMRSNDNISVYPTTGEVIVGGVIGNIESETVRGINIAKYMNMSVYTLNGCKSMVVGGVIGNSSSAPFEISESGFGGNLIVDNINNGSTLSVGGIVGSAKASSESNVRSAYSFGNVYLSYNDASRLNEYNFGGVIGKYQPSDEIEDITLSISNSYLLMSNFNDRMTGDLSNYHANAVVGYGSESINFANNYYASGVTFTLQTETGNIDSYYAGVDATTTPSYYGYQFSNDDVVTTNINVLSGLRNGLQNILTTNAIKQITKLNPIELTIDFIEANYEEGATDAFGWNNPVTDESSIRILNKVNWFYLSGSLGGEDNYLTTRIQTLDNAVIVGNGQVINFKSNEGITEVGETLDDENLNYGFIQNMATRDGYYSAVTNLVINNTVNVVVNENDSATVGGLVGHAGSTNGGTSILYAVGVNGSITVGGTGSAYVGGIVGGMQSNGMINNAYFDGDIYYSAGAEGSVNGIVYSQDYLEILNTFSAGSVQAYSSLNTINLFNGSNNGEDIRIFDSYTIMQQFNNNVVSNVSVSVTGDFVGDTQNNTFSDGDGDNYQTRSVGYGGMSYYKYSLSINRDSESEEIDTPDDNGYVNIENPETLNAWFYSPYKNYGYATTGFGFLRNITIAHRTPENLGGEETGSVNYEYTNYTTDEVAGIADETTTSEYFYPILNESLFSEMITLPSNDANVEAKDKNYMLRYDISVGKLVPEGEDSVDFEEGFTLDGRNNVMTVSENDYAIFDVVYGNIENLRIRGVNVSNTVRSAGDMQVYGTLANVAYGAKIRNVSVQGEMNISRSTYNLVGGVIGVLAGSESEIDAVESVVNFTFGKEGNNIVGGVVGYAVNGTISYSSNAGNINIEDSISSNEQARRELPASFSISDFGGSLSLSITSNIQINTTNNNGGTEDDEEIGLKEVAPSSIIGGVVGVSNVTVDHSFNTASIINGYKQFEESDTARERELDVGTVISGGVVGYSTGKIEYSFNTGYIVSGNMYNKSSSSSGYPAFAGGIVGYSTNSTLNCYNDGKVRAVSYLDKSSSNYSIEVKASINDGYWENLSGIGEDIDARFANSTSSTLDVTLKTSITYNVNGKYRLVFANAIGYSASDNADALSGRNGEYAEIVNDGNIGQISTEVSKTYTIQRYYGVTFNGSQYGVEDYVDFNVGKDGATSVVTSGYDSYGFPNRLNLYYRYTFDLAISGVFDGGQFWSANADNKMRIDIKDPTPYSDSVSGITVEATDYTGTGENSAKPGGTTNRYISLPFYSTSDGSSYEEYVNRLNENANKSDQGGEDISINELYSQITEYTSDNSEEKRMNIKGEEYSIAYNGNQLAAYTKGMTFSGSVQIENVPTLSIGDKQISSSSIRVESMNFTLKNGNAETGLEQLSYSTYISGSGSEYYINYSVYYDKEEIYNEFSSGGSVNLEPLSIDVSYNVAFTFSDNIILSKNNVTRNGNKVTFYVPNADLEAQSFGDYFDEQGIADIQDEQIPVEFAGIDNNLIASLKGDDGNYYIDFVGTSAYAEFDDDTQAEAFISAIESGSVSMTFRYYVLGTGDYEDYNLVNTITSSLPETINMDYVIGMSDFAEVGTVNSNNGYVSLTPDDSAYSIKLQFNSGSDVIKIESSIGEIYYYSNGINNDSGNKFEYSLNTTGTGLTDDDILTSSPNNYMQINFSNNAQGAYQTFLTALNNGSVFTASIDTNLDTVVVPKTLTRTINGVEVIYTLDTKAAEAAGFDTDLVDGEYVVTRNEGNNASVFSAIYRYDSTGTSTGRGQLITNGTSLAYVENVFALQNEVDGQMIGIRDTVNNVTYEFTVGDDTLYELNSDKEQYTQTIITYNGITLNIYRFADGREIREYDFGSSSYLIDGTTAHAVYTSYSEDGTETEERVELGTPISENYFFVDPGSAFGQFDVSGIAGDENGNVYLAYEGGLYTGSFDGYNYDGSSATYNGEEVSGMFYCYSLSSSDNMAYVITQGETELKNTQVELHFSENWFVQTLPNFYFIADSIDNAIDGDTIYQTITFDEENLKYILEDGATAFQVRQYARTLAGSNTIQLHYGTPSIPYITSGTTDWDYSNSNSIFDISGGSVRLNDDSLQFGEHSGNVVFVATVTSDKNTEHTYKIPDEERKLIETSLTDFDAVNIILGNNIYYEGNIKLNGSKLYGDGYILNLFGSMNSWENMVEINDGGLIDNTTIVFMVDLSEYSYASDNENYSASLIYLGIEKSEDTSNIGSISDVNLYGALRNINSNTADNRGIISNNARRAHSGGLSLRTVYLLDSSSPVKIGTVTSYMTIQGNNAQSNKYVDSRFDGVAYYTNEVNGASVSVILDINSEINSSNSYIVLGDGANGSNGSDGLSDGGSGYNGGNGGKAGYVIVSGDYTPTIYQGADGVGGNGGNGTDGSNARNHNNLSTGGGGGGAYGLDAKYYSRLTSGDSVGQTFYGLDADSILSNRRQAKQGENYQNIDETQQSALGGSGGSGGLGLIYYDETREDIEGALRRGGNIGVGGGDGPTYYYGNSEDITSYYITAAGGGSAGLRYLNGNDVSTVLKGESGGDGVYRADYTDGAYDRSNDVYRGTLTNVLVDVIGILVWQYTDMSWASHSYYWSDHHGNFADEFLFGDLQYIPALSHWYIDSDHFVGDDDSTISIDSIYNEKVVTINGTEYNIDLGGVVAGGEYSDKDVDFDTYELFIRSYILMSDQLNYYQVTRGYKSNSWKMIFYGGKGATCLEVSTDSSLYGGTPYTSEIYGFTTYKFSFQLGAYAKDQFFFSRNDMVTSAGQYGTAQGVSAPNYNQ